MDIAKVIGRKGLGMAFQSTHPPHWRVEHLAPVLALSLSKAGSDWVRVILLDTGERAISACN